MRIAKVIGTVTLNKYHPSYRGANLKLVVPLTLENLLDESEPTGDTLVAWDEMGAGVGSWIALSEGPEAAQPFRPEVKPLEAYATAILDHVKIDRALAESLLE